MALSNSILTNVSALEALQALNASSAALDRTDDEISTGLAVAGARDDPATYGIAQALRGQDAAWGAASDSLGRAQSTVDVAASGSEQISDLLNQLKAKTTAYADPSLSSVDKAAIQTDAQALIAQIDQVAGESSFDGVGLLAGQGVPGIVARSGVQSTYAATSPLTPQSFTTLMGVTSNGGSTDGTGSSSTVAGESMTSTTTYSLPYSTLTPASFAQAMASMHSLSTGTAVTSDRTTVSAGGSARLQYGGVTPPAAPASASVALDDYTTAAGFTVQQGGTVLASSTGAPAAGRQILNYTYDPSGGPVTVTSSSSTSWSVLNSPAAGDPNVTLTSSGGGQASDGQPLTLATAGGAPTSGVQSMTVDGGGQAGRVDMLFDASIDPSTVEVYQNGVRVAATGQPYTPGGAPVGSATPVTGQSVLSFDYDPSKGTNLTFDFNGGTSDTGAGWAVGALSLAPLGSPPPALQSTTTTSESSSDQIDETGTDYTGTPPPLTPELDSMSSGTKSYTLAGGTTAGYVQLGIDTYDSPDIVEIYQNGVRVAASGQAAASNGAPVAPGAAVTGEQTLGFDYDPTNGQTLSIQVTQADPQTPDGWLVQDMTLQTGGTSLSPSSTSTGGPYNQTATVPYAFIKAADGSQLSVQSRDLTAAGLGLDPLDWNDPDAIVQAVQQAITTANSAAAYFGEQQTLVGGLLTQASQRQDTLTTGIGNLVDADMATASAAQQAEQVKQQLAMQALSIANALPTNLLSLFRG